MKGIILLCNDYIKDFPITREIPVGLLPVHGRTIVDNIIDLFFKHGVFEIWLSYNKKNINQYSEKFSFPVILTDKENSNYLFLIKRDIINNFKKDFIIANGCAVLNFNIAKAVDFHKKEKNIITKVISKNNEVSEYYIVNPKIFKYVAEKTFFSDVIKILTAEKEKVGDYVCQESPIKCDSMGNYEKILNWEGIN